MKIHPAGKEIVNWTILVLGILGLSIIMFLPYQYFWLIYSILLVLAVTGTWIACFFRYPVRKLSNIADNTIYSAADGKVVVVEKIKSDLFPEGEAFQISVFMSIYSVHLNYMPVSGIIKSVTHKRGKHLMAVKPKASLENEQCETIVETSNGKIIIVRQIAGAAARRVLTFVDEGQNVLAGEELGFIRFGSRVDHIIPVNSTIKVRQGDKVKGCFSILAEINN